jgi:DNA (cytosine-5)-methyltransferase 1
MLTIGSLFSGIGGLELGIEAGLAAAGYPSRTIWQVEQDEYCRAVLARHWPHAHRLTDVTTLNPSSLAAVDIVCGGFPCQDISTSGRGAGIHGARSGLFYDMAALVRHLRPRIWIMENSPELNIRGLDDVLGTVAALGYDARWGSLRASAVGAPHRRERWFCVAWVADTDKGLEKTRGRAQGMGRLKQPIPEHRGGPATVEPSMGRGAHGAAGRVDRHRWPAPPGPQYPYEPPRTRPHTRRPTDRKRLSILGNAVVPQQASVIGRWVGEHLLTPHRRT